jgi:WD40 repeat protein
LDCQDGINSASISPDGQWVACTPWSGTKIKVWDRDAVKVVKELPLAGNVAVAAFSPAGDRLVVSDPAEIRIWKTSSWELLASIQRDRASGIVGRIVISSDGRTLAGQRGRNHGIVLVALDSGRELATIDAGIPLCFGADGTQLAAWNEDTGKLMLWDLRQIRQELAGMKLDWEAPPFAPAPPDPQAPPSPDVRH